MAKTKTKPEINFLENPDNVTIGDWVKDIHNNKVGQISERVETGPNMLEFWIKFADTTLGTALAMDLRKAEPPTTICKTVNLKCIKIDSNLQQRVKLDSAVVEEYAIALENGVTFPPITIWYCTDKNKTYLVDGFHRVKAAKKAGIDELPYTEKSGTYREAKFFTLGVNATHGLPRSNADKRKVVTTLLNDPEWSQLSDREISRQCGVSNRFVSNLRKSICEPYTDTKLNNPDGSTDTNLNNKRKVTRGGKTYIQDTTNIGKGKIKETGNDNPPKKRKYIKNGKEVEMDVSKAIVDPEIFPEEPGTPLLDSENNPDSDSQEKQSLTKFGNNQTDNNDSTISEPEPEDNQIFPEDVIKNLDWDEVEDEVEDNSVNEEDKPEIPTPTKPNKRTKKKQRLVNPLSVGDKVKVKDNHYFGGKIGEVTQIANVNSVIVAFEDNHRELLYLEDLDLPESLQKPQLLQPQRPRKKEIILKEGLNYFVKESEDKCRWYVELDKEIYQGLKIYQERVQAMSVNAGISRFLENEGILLRPFPENKIIDEKPSPINSLNSETRNKLENIVEKHGVDAIFKKFEE